MYLGIDIGTSSVKAVLVDDKDTVVEQASAPLNVSRPHAGWSEQNPADWWTATNAAVAATPAIRPMAGRHEAPAGLVSATSAMNVSPSQIDSNLVR